jgi:hypothetical protein
MGPKGEPDTKTNWSTDRRPQDKLDSTVARMRLRKPHIHKTTNHEVLSTNVRTVALRLGKQTVA